MIGEVDGANWAEALTGIGTILIAFGVVFAGIQVRDTRKARSAEIARELAEQWESPRMEEARKLVNGHGSGPGSTERLRDAITEARKAGSDEFYVYARWLNFFEQLGISFRRHSQAIGIVEEMYSETITTGWATWQIVVASAWGSKSNVGKNFGLLAEKIQKRQQHRRQWLRFHRFFTDPMWPEPIPE
jgi:hypothetical protein